MTDLLRIKSITVKKLFGYLDHYIPLNTEERITILHGLNGSGKTSILKILDSIFNKSFVSLRKIPFAQFIIEFESGKTLIFEKINENISVKLTKQNDEKHFFTLKPLFKNREDEHLIHILRDFAPPWIEYRGRDQWINLKTKTKISTSDLLIDYKGQVPPEIIHEIYKKENIPDWFIKLLVGLPIRFFETERLFKRNITQFERFKRDEFERYNRKGYEIEYPVKLAVEDICEDISSQINSIKTKIANKSLEMSESMMDRLLSLDPNNKFKKEEEINRNKEHKEKYEKLRTIGLIDKDQDKKHFKLDFDQDIIDRNLAAIYLYNNDTEEKLSIYNDLEYKAGLLVEIINKRFEYSGKSIIFDSQHGIKVISHNTILSPTDLSSGEQQELVLFYGLLFDTKPGSLILIDEPELSLHVLWQRSFLDDIKNISKVADLDFLIATHSSAIIGNYDDLAVTLKVG